MVDRKAAAHKAAAKSSSPKTGSKTRTTKKTTGKPAEAATKSPATEGVPARDPSREQADEPRVGVFVCHCGVNTAGFLDVEDVTEYAKALPYVVFATRNLYTCAEDGISDIKQAIVEHNLNRIVVASCTPRTHEPLFRAACEEAGLNKYLFEFANIRDQCSWVHMNEWDQVTAKARDLVRMSVMRAALLEPLEEITIDIHPASLVIGAPSIADQGFEVFLVEKEAEVGGSLRGLDNLSPTNADHRYQDATFHRGPDPGADQGGFPGTLQGVAGL